MSSLSQALLAKLLAEHPELDKQITAISEALVVDLRRTNTPTNQPVVSAATFSNEPFARLLDVTCIVPRGKHHFEISECDIVLHNKSDSNTPLVLKVSNITGIFFLQILDRYRKGADGATHVVVITLREAIHVGKTAHLVVAFAENGAKLAMTSPCSVPLLRPFRDSLHNAALLAQPGALEGLQDQFAAMRTLLSAVCGKIGESDLSVYKSATGAASLKAYNKANEGFLFPMRRALIFGLKPLIAIPHSEISSVKVGRAGGTGVTRTFDLDVFTLDGKTTQFSMIDNIELDSLRTYVAGRTFGRATALAENSDLLGMPVSAPRTGVSSASPELLTAHATLLVQTAGVDLPGPLIQEAPVVASTKVAFNMNEGDSDEDAGSAVADSDTEDEDEDDSVFVGTSSDSGGSTDSEDERDYKPSNFGHSRSLSKNRPRDINALDSGMEESCSADSNLELQDGGASFASSDSDTDDAAVSNDELEALLADAAVEQKLHGLEDHGALRITGISKRTRSSRQAYSYDALGACLPPPLAPVTTPDSGISTGALAMSVFSSGSAVRASSFEQSEAGKQSSSHSSVNTSGPDDSVDTPPIVSVDGLLVDSESDLFCQVQSSHDFKRQRIDGTFSN